MGKTESRRTATNANRREAIRTFAVGVAAAMLAAPRLHSEEAATAAKRVAITIDDGPAVGTGDDFEAFASISGRIRDAFVAAKAPAIMFVNEQQLHVDGQRDARAKVLEAWLEAGLDLGNHTYSHFNLGDVELSDYLDDIVKGEVITRPLMRSRGRELTWFRYPYLAAGDGEKAETVEAFLAERDYRVAPVTVSYADYSFASNYARMIRSGESAEAEKIAREVDKAAAAAFARAERQSQELLRYQLPQILLIHCNELNARTLPDMLEFIRGLGYEFTSIERAMEDPAYQTHGMPSGSMGGSFFNGLAKAAERQ